jgi:protein disulfide-isomerase A6
VAAVNCEAHAAVCQARGVTGYPTIKAFKEGRWVDYRGDRSAAHLRDWALGLLPAGNVAVVARPAQLPAFLKACQPGGVKWGACALLFTAKTDTSALYKSLALRYKGRLAFGEVRGANEELARRFNVTSFPSLVTVCGGSEDATIRYADDLKNSKLVKFLNAFYSPKKCGEAIRVDATTDLSKMRVAQLKQILEARGGECRECVEKGDFVRRIQALLAAGAAAGTA